MTMAGSLRGIADRDRAYRTAWSTGHLYFLLDSNQRKMYSAYRKSQSPKFVFDVARRVGKSTTMSLCAIEDCLRRPRALVKYGAATQEMVREMIIPLFNWILETCPADMQPRWVQSDSSYLFTNGSRIKMVGLDLHPDRLRGQAMDSGYLDEAAFVDELEYVVQSILIPQMQGKPHARILMGSTPPATPGHPWTVRYCPEAKLAKAYVHSTIMDNPRLSEGEKQFFIEEAGGAESITNRRENFAEHIVDDSLAIIPEFINMESQVVHRMDRPRHFDAYVSMDVGFTDLTAILYAHYNFQTNQIVIEKDSVLARANTGQIVDEIKKSEYELWGAFRQKDGNKHPKLRISDVEPRLVSDLATMHDLQFVMTPKDDKEAAINAVRMAIQKQKIIISPRCEHLISHLKNGIWNRKRTSFERSGDFGHFDCIDALVYLVRNVHKGQNPYPQYENGESTKTHWMPPPQSINTDTGKQFRDIFRGNNGRSRRWVSNNTGHKRPPTK